MLRRRRSPPVFPGLQKSKRHCADDKSMFRLMDLRKNVYAMRCFLRCIIPSNATPPTAIIDHVEGSGTDGRGVLCVLLPVANDNKWSPIKWVRILAIRL